MSEDNTLAPRRPAVRNRAFLLRCWFEGEQWRLFLESSTSPGDHRGFTSVETVCAYVRGLLDDAGGTPAP